MIQALAMDSEMTLETKPTGTSASAATSKASSLVIPLSQGRSVRPEDLPAMTAETHFTVVKDTVVLKKIKGRDIIATMFTVLASGGFGIREIDVRALTCALDDKGNAQLTEYAVQRPSAAAPESLRVAVYQPNLKGSVSSISLSVSVLLEEKKGVKRSSSGGASTTPSTSRSASPSSPPSSAAPAAEAAAASACPTAGAPAKPAMTKRESHLQAFYIKESIPTKADVTNHLHLLLNTVYYAPVQKGPDSWKRVLDTFSHCISLDALRRCLKETKPPGWSDVSADLHSLEFTLTPLEMYRGVQHLLQTELKVDMDSADDSEVDKWATLLNAISSVRKSTSFIQLVKTLKDKPAGLPRLQNSLQFCRDIVVESA
jgi:hypothetical protein